MQSKNIFFNSLLLTWKYSKGVKFEYIIVFFLLAYNAFVFTLQSILFGWVIHKLQMDTESSITSIFLLFGCFYLGMLIARWVGQIPMDFLTQRIAFQLQRNYMDTNHSYLMLSDLRWMESHNSTVVNEAFKRSGEGIFRTYLALTSLSLTVIQFLFTMIGLLYFSTFFGVMATLIIWIPLKLQDMRKKRFQESIRARNETEHEVFAIQHESFSNYFTIHANRIQDRYTAKLLKSLDGVYPLIVEHFKQLTIRSGSFDLGMFTVQLMMIVGYVYENYTPGQVMELGGLVTLMTLTTQFIGSFSSISGVYFQLIQTAVDIKSLSDLKPEQAEFIENNQNVTTGNIDWVLDIRNLKFHYGKAGSTFKGVNIQNLSIKKGDKIGIIGENGGGKSTLIKVLAGLYKPQEGFQINSNFSKNLNWADLKDFCLMMPQEPEIFEDTLRENLTLGNNFSDERVKKACEDSGLISYFDGIPDFLSQTLTQNGGNFSGGMKQRLIVARCLLLARDKQIIILDEPTSNIDPKNESFIVKNLLQRFQDKTVIMTLHRHHLLNDCNRVWTVSHGMLFEKVLATPNKASSQQEPQNFLIE